MRFSSFSDELVCVNLNVWQFDLSSDQLMHKKNFFSVGTENIEDETTVCWWYGCWVSVDSRTD